MKRSLMISLSLAIGLSSLSSSAYSAEHVSSKKETEFLNSYQKNSNSVTKPDVCTNGQAGQYDCKNMDLMRHIPLDEIKSKPSRMNGIWGFVNMNNSREYGFVGLNNGVALIDVGNPDNLYNKIISSEASLGREIRTFQCQDTRTNQ